MKTITSFVCILSLFHFAFVGAATPQMPRLVIKTIKNDTPYDLIITDRFNKKKFKAPANQIIVVSFLIKNYKNIAINGSMRDCMAAKAQFVVEPKEVLENYEKEQQTYLNLSLTPGGVDDGSGIISGSLGSIAYNFLMAGAKSGCIMSCRQIKNNTYKEVEIDIELSVNPRDEKNKIFRLDTSVNLTEK